MGTTASQYEDTVHLSRNSKPKSSKKKAEDVVESESIDEVEEEIKQPKSKIKVDQIDENQAKQDLMAYLEIVGEHADDLPITWRDDPELGRSVSTLTSKQYAVKADAFFPCDVRVIATTCIKYGDSSFRLPNKDNFYLGERAQDPGLSQGGAVANSLLKVIYDFENDNLKPIAGEDGNGNDYLVTENLFDDDDDDDGYDYEDDDEGSFGSLQFDGMMSGATLTWSELLRRMKDEMEDLKYDQVPTISASRRFDLNEPVYLLPETFDPKKNRKFSLLIGCNYKREVGALKKSHDDIHMVKDYIVNVFGFPEDDEYMTLLIDDKKHKKPTYKNILRAMKLIALRSRPGDAVFIQYSGHGGRLVDLGTRTADCYDEVIVPSDFKSKGFITDKAIFQSLLVPMAEDVTVTMVLDSCDTGVMMDLPFSWGTLDDDTDSQAKLSLNDSFSFIRLLNVVKQLYDSSINAANDEDAPAEDSDGSIVTIDADREDHEEEDDDDDDDSEEESSDNSTGEDEEGTVDRSNEEKLEKLTESAQKIMSSINNAVQVMADEAEHTGKTAMKMYELFVNENEKRDRREGGKSGSRKGYDKRDDIYDDEESFYSDDEEYRSFSSESEDSYVARRKNSRRSPVKNKRW